MRKLLLPISFVLGTLFVSNAETNLSLENRVALRNLKSPTPDFCNQKIDKVKAISSDSDIVPAMIKLSNNATVKDLESNGVNVIKVRGDIAIVMLPVSDVERIATLKSVDKLHLSRPLNLKMNNVRKETGVDKIHSGDGLSQPYTGKGVVTGLVDGGIQPNHINFLDENGISRFKHLTHIYIDEYSSDGFTVENYTDRISEFSTDDPIEFHGTHTSGIMAGGYKGNITASLINNNGLVDINEIPNPFYGIATDADIAASCGDLNEILVALGIEGIIEYAQSQHKPAVINLSLGSNLGSHDGKDVMNQYLELAGEEAIICMAAGNEGMYPIALNQTFSGQDNELKTFIKPLVELEGYQNLRYGQTYVYSNDDSEFVIKAVIYNKNRGTYSFMLPIESNTGGVPIYYASDEYLQEGDNSNAAFSKAFNGYLGMGSMIDENSGRYYTLIDYMLWDNIEDNADANYMLGFVVEGKDGQRIDCYTDGRNTCFDSYDQDGWDNGMTNGSIVNQATGKNVIVVGAYNLTTEWGSLDGYTYTYDKQFMPGEMSSFTSYATLIDGRELPHVCAPGLTLISSSNTSYIDNLNGSIYDLNAILQGSTEINGENYYWHQQLGTSMATPVVSGSIALWLEANPLLTVNEALDIIQTTATKDKNVNEFSGDKVQWGAGKFNAYEGLKEAIRLYEAGIENNLIADKKVLIKSNADNLFNIFVGGVSTINISIFDLAGNCVISQTIAGDNADIDANNLNPGVYILKVNDCTARKIIVK